MNVAKYLLFRLISFLLQFFGGMILVFVTFELIPYDPKGIYLWGAATGGASAQELQQLSEQLDEQWGRNDPVYIQFYNFIRDLILQGSLGNSWHGGAVTNLLRDTLPYTLLLSLISLLIIIPLSLYLGIISATKVQSKTDFNIKLITSITYGIPYYIFAVLFLFVMEIQEWQFDTGRDRYLLLSLTLIIIIVITMTSFQYRIIRKEFLEVLDENYILTARSKGLKERIVIYKHAFKNIRPEIIQSYNTLIPLLVSAVVVNEYIFHLPGIGEQLVFTVEWLDWGFLIGLSAVFLIMVGLVNMFTDMIITVIDPLRDKA